MEMKETYKTVKVPQHCKMLKQASACEAGPTEHSKHRSSHQTSSQDGGHSSKALDQGYSNFKSGIFICIHVSINVMEPAGASVVTQHWLS